MAELFAQYPATVFQPCDIKYRLQNQFTPIEVSEEKDKNFKNHKKVNRYAMQNH